MPRPPSRSSPSRQPLAEKVPWRQKAIQLKAWAVFLLPRLSSLSKSLVDTRTLSYMALMHSTLNICVAPYKAGGFL